MTSTSSTLIKRSTLERTKKAASVKSRSQAAQNLPQALQAASPIDAQWCVGVLEPGSEPAQWLVRSGGWSAKATPAASCLLSPARGDSVACLKVAPDQVWIMAVLSREEGTPNCLQFQGPTQLQVFGGGLQLQAQQLDLQSSQLRVDTSQAQLSMDTAQVVGKQLKVTAGVVKLVGSSLSTVMERIQQFSQNYLRTTDGTDQVNAGHVKMQAKQLMQLDAEHALITGEQLVKARGAQIHFG
jgi:hypothetical protein